MLFHVWPVKSSFLLVFCILFKQKGFFLFVVTQSKSCCFCIPEKQLHQNQLTPQNLELICTLYPQLPVIKQMYIYGSAELFQTVSVILSTPAADRRALQAALMSTRCVLTFLNTNKLHTSHHLLLCASDLILKCKDLVFLSRHQ